MKKWWVWGGGILFLALVLQWLARTVPGFGQWYSVSVYPLFVGTLGRFFGIVPFSVVELGIYFLILLCIVYGIRFIRSPLRLLSRMFVLLSVLLLTYTLNCGINYYRNPFSSYLDFEIKQFTVSELYEMCEYLTVQVNELAGIRDGSRMGQQGQALGRQAMEDLGERYPQLSGYYPRPKGVLCSYMLSVQQLCGIYSPFTVEANYNRSMPGYNIPNTVCHELSHLKGFMREDEANFIGFLACIGSESPELRYSGYLTSWVYAGNALATADREAYVRLYQTLDPSVISDLEENSRYWAQYEGTVAEAANQLNDTYLKINSQTDGVRSYGRVTDLMLAYYRHQKN